MSACPVCPQSGPYGSNANLTNAPLLLSPPLSPDFFRPCWFQPATPQAMEEDRVPVAAYRVWSSQGGWSTTMRGGVVQQGAWVAPRLRTRLRRGLERTRAAADVWIRSLEVCWWIMCLQACDFSAILGYNCLWYIDLRGYFRVFDMWIRFVIVWTKRTCPCLFGGHCWVHKADILRTNVQNWRRFGGRRWSCPNWTIVTKENWSYRVL